MLVKDKSFATLEKRINDLDYPTDYIPAVHEICEMADKDLKKYMPFFLWVSKHHPKPMDENEKKALKYLKNFIYENLEIDFDDDIEDAEDAEDTEA